MRSVRPLAIGMLALALSTLPARAAAPSVVAASLAADGRLIAQLTTRVLTLVAGSVPVPAPEARVLAVRADASHVELHWLAPAGAVAPRVLRRTERGAWAPVGRAALADGEATFTDAAVAPGARYRYALEAGGETRTGEARVEVPGPLALSVRGLRREAGSAAVVAFALPEDSHARVAVLDASGRVVWTRDFVPEAAGEQALRLESEPRLAPGVYRVTLAQGPRLAMARVTLGD